MRTLLHLQSAGGKAIYSSFRLNCRVITSRHASSLSLGVKSKAEEWLIESDRRILNVSRSYCQLASNSQRVKDVESQTTATSPTPRVQQLLDSTASMESGKRKQKIYHHDRAHFGRLEDLVNMDDVTEFFPPEVNSMYRMILQGNESRAWEVFATILAKGERDGPSASIWHWYLMIGLAARDSTISIQDAIKMASLGCGYEESIVRRSLKDEAELGGVREQQRVLAFTLMHNFRKRMTTDALEAVISIWDIMLQQEIHASSRHVNVLCASLIHLKRGDEALKILSEWMRPALIDDSSQEDPQGWISNWQGGVPMNQYTVGIIMFALLQEGYSKRAFEMYKASISDTYRVPVHNVPLNLLLWAGRQPYEGIASCRGQVAEEDFASVSEDVSRNVQHWQDQAMWDGHPSALQARHIFLFNLFSRYPELQEIENPLYQIRQGDENGFMWKAHARMQRWTESFNNLVAPYVRWQKTTEDAILLHASSDHKTQSNNFHKRFQVDDLTFDHYLGLLPYVSIYEDVPWEDYVIVLAWMKHLGIKPGRYTLMKICWAIDHLIPPVVGDFPSCAGPLHEYLADWIGEVNIPERADMARFIKSLHFARA